MNFKYFLFLICLNSIYPSCSKDNKGVLNVDYNLGENGRISIQASADGAVLSYDNAMLTMMG